MKRFLVLAGLVACATACGGGGGPRQFVVVTTPGDGIKDGSGGKCPLVPTTPSLTTQKSFLQDGTFTLYQGDAETWYLVSGGTAVSGTLADGTYTFTDDSKVETTSPSLDAPQLKETDEQVTTLTFTLDGSDLTGSANVEYKDTCANVGGDSNACSTASLPSFHGAYNDDFGPIDCVQTTTVTGVELPAPEFKQQTTTPGAGNF